MLSQGDRIIVENHTDIISLHLPKRMAYCCFFNMLQYLLCNLYQQYSLSWPALRGLVRSYKHLTLIGRHDYPSLPHRSTSGQPTVTCNERR